MESSPQPLDNGNAYDYKVPVRHTTAEDATDRPVRAIQPIARAHSQSFNSALAGHSSSSPSSSSEESDASSNLQIPTAASQQQPPAADSDGPPTLATSVQRPSFATPLHGTAIAMPVDYASTHPASLNNNLRTSSPGLSNNSASWFGATHYEQVDASFAKAVSDVPMAPVEEKEERLFKRRKSRYGHVTYLESPSANRPPLKSPSHRQQPLSSPKRRKSPLVIIAEPIQTQSRNNVPIVSEEPRNENNIPSDEPCRSPHHAPRPTDHSAKAGSEHESVKLGQWRSTAIAANDVTSSCYYAISICCARGGIWAPLCFLFVVGVLYLFRYVYTEAVTALPLNGGAYNVLLNTTSKKTASVFGVLSILSYVATGVVSAASAMSYLHFIWPSLPNSAGVVILIVFFALLTLFGMSESSTFAASILTVHMSALAVLVVTTVVWLSTHPSEQTFTHNVSSSVNPSVPLALLLGYASAMLGVSGFETSANFVEEQQESVFGKTLRNMWMLVSIINPTLALLCVTALPLEEIISHDYTDVLLAYLGERVGGDWLKYLVSFDAFLVLAASVLTAYIGVTGLARRLALDRGLPQILLTTNRLRHTNHWIILVFCVICITLYFITSGDVTSLGNVYAVSFLLVMSGFAVGNMLLKFNRPGLKREVRASWLTTSLALLLALLALGSLIGYDPSVLAVWAVYFLVCLSAVGLMFFRVKVLKIIYYMTASMAKSLSLSDCPDSNRVLRALLQWIQLLGEEQTIFFSKHGRLEVMNQAVLYILQNEEATRVRIVHVYEHEHDIPPCIARHTATLDQQYSAVQISLVLVKGVFSAETVDWIAETLGVAKNMCFLTAPRGDFRVKLETLGGVRIIIR